MIWQADNDTKERELDPQQRLEYHQKHSLPAMEKLRAWAEEKKASYDYEEHSSLGKAIKYFLKHYDRLILFCIETEALIDNNLMEEKLKIVIRGRKTAHFYKTANGAGVANVLISLIATAYGDEKNIYDYLLALQRYSERVKKSPANGCLGIMSKLLRKLKLSQAKMRWKSNVTQLWRKLTISDATGAVTSVIFYMLTRPNFDVI